MALRDVYLKIEPVFDYYPVASVPRRAGQDRLSADAAGRTTSEQGAAILREFHVSGRKLDEAKLIKIGAKGGEPRPLCRAKLLAFDQEALTHGNQNAPDRQTIQATAISRAAANSAGRANSGTFINQIHRQGEVGV